MPTKAKNRPRTDRELALAWFKAVTRRKRCAVCNQKDPRLQAHHVIQAQVLRREYPLGARWDQNRLRWVPIRRGEDPESFASSLTFEQVRWHPWNGLPLCSKHHELHSNHAEKVPLDKLPAAALKFAICFGLQHRLGPRFYA